VTAAGIQRPGFLAIAFERGIVRRSLIIAAIVGTILNVINQGDALFGGGGIVAWKLVLTYCVPYCVATYGAATARLASAAGSERGIR
jgi:hypothetical protein